RPGAVRRERLMGKRTTGLVLAAFAALVPIARADVTTADIRPVTEAVAALANSQDAERVRAARELGERGTAAKAAVPALANAWLSDRSPAVQAEAARALARIGPAAVPALSSGLIQESGTVRLQAIRALAKVGPDAAPAVALLRAALRDGSADVRA